MNNQDSKRCICNWNAQCFIFQQALLKHEHPLGGCVEIRFRNTPKTNKLSDKNEALKRSFIRHLKPPPNAIDNQIWIIAKHHFPQQIIDDYNSSKNSLANPIPQSIATKYGYREASDLYPHSVSLREQDKYRKDSKFFVRAPIIPKNDIKLLVKSLESDRLSTKRKRSVMEDDKNDDMTPVEPESQQVPSKPASKPVSISNNVSVPTLIYGKLIMKAGFDCTQEIQEDMEVVNIQKMVNIMTKFWKDCNYDEIPFMKENRVKKYCTIMNSVLNNHVRAVKLIGPDDKNSFLYFCVSCNNIFMRLCCIQNNAKFWLVI